MSKKSFKDNTANIDRFFSDAPKPEQEKIETQEPQKADKTQRTHYRIDLKLRPEYREYLEDESWKARKSITEYVNDLIQEDMNRAKS